MSPNSFISLARGLEREIVLGRSLSMKVSSSRLLSSVSSMSRALYIIFSIIFFLFFLRFLETGDKFSKEPIFTLSDAMRRRWEEGWSLGASRMLNSSSWNDSLLLLRPPKLASSSSKSMDLESGTSTSRSFFWKGEADPKVKLFFSWNLLLLVALVPPYLVPPPNVNLEVVLLGDKIFQGSVATGFLLLRLFTFRVNLEGKVRIPFYLGDKEVLGESF